MYEQRSFQELVVLHLLVVSIAASVFLFLIPIVPWWWGLVATVVFFIWHRRIRSN